MIMDEVDKLEFSLSVYSIMLISFTVTLCKNSPKREDKE